MITGGAGSPVQAQSGFEKEPVLNARNLVAPELLKGPYFTVDDAVPVKGMLARFTIRSPYGTFEAHGIHMLAIRVTEVHAIGKLDELSKTKEFAEAAGRAIVRPVTSAVNMLVHPVESVEGFPDGVGRLFGRIDLGFKRVAEAATAPDQSGGQRAEGASKRVGSATLNALGWEKERRDLAKSLGVDPYTTNKVLSEKLTSAAWVAFSGRFLIQTATTILVPYSMAMSATTITNSTIYDTPPGDLVNKATDIFTSTGASEAQVQALVQNPQYSLSVLTALAQGVQRLKDVPGRNAVVTFAAAARTQDETRFLAAAMNMLARHHESVAPILEVSAPGPDRRPHHHRRAARSPPRRLRGLDPDRRPSRGAAGPEVARPSPLHFRSGIAPSPQGAPRAALEDQRGLLDRGGALRVSRSTLRSRNCTWNWSCQSGASLLTFSAL